MKNSKRIMLLLLAAVLLLSLAGCRRNRAGERSDVQSTEAPVTEAPVTEAPATEAPVPTVDPNPVEPENEDILLPQVSILG